MGAALLILLALIVGYGIGWANAHYTVAEECEKLGKFYVGHRVFECVKISVSPSQEEE